MFTRPHVYFYFLIYIILEKKIIAFNTHNIIILVIVKYVLFIDDTQRITQRHFNVNTFLKLISTKWLF